jgi:DNA-directed RNA polymerase subunit RPC12/RpoP
LKKLKRAQVTERILEDFINLADKRAAEIESFAQRFGVLGLCRHGFGLGNRWHAQQIGRSCGPQTSSGQSSESVEDWWWWTRLFRATLESASALHGKERAPADSWAILIPDDVKISSLLQPRWKPLGLDDTGQVLNTMSRDDLWNWLMDVLNLAVLPQASLEPRGYKTKHAVEMRLAPDMVQSALFAVLASELLAAVVRAKAFYTCSNCGKWFSPESLKHKPRTGKRRYCPECGIQAAWRDAKRRERAKRTGSDD